MEQGLRKSKEGSLYELDSKLVPKSEELKAIIERYDQIDHLTQKFLKDLGALMGIRIKEMAHFDTSSEVRDLAMSQLEKEFSTLLPPLDFEF